MKAVVPLYNQTGVWYTWISIFCVETVLDCTISRTAGAEMYTQGTFTQQQPQRTAVVVVPRLRTAYRTELLPCKRHDPELDMK